MRAQYVPTGEIETGRYISFLLDKQEFGIHINRVKEIKEIMPIVRVPNAPNYISGVINLRGTIVPIIDLRLRIGISAAEPTRDTGIIIVTIENRLGGLVVDRIEDVKAITTDDVDKTPDFIVDKLDISFIEGVARLGDALLVLLDVGAVFSK